MLSLTALHTRKGLVDGFVCTLYSLCLPLQHLKPRRAKAEELCCPYVDYQLVISPCSSLLLSLLCHRVINYEFCLTLSPACDRRTMPGSTTPPAATTAQQAAEQAHTRMIQLRGQILGRARESIYANADIMIQLHNRANIREDQRYRLITTIQNQVAECEQLLNQNPGFVAARLAYTRAEAAARATRST